MKNKAFIIFVLLFLIIGLSSCATSTNTDTPSDSTSQGLNDIKAYDATILDSANGYFINFTLEWTNTSDSPVSFVGAYEMLVFQNGLECDKDIEQVGTGNSLPHTTNKLYFMYRGGNTQTNITIYLTEKSTGKKRQIDLEATLKKLP